MTELSIVPESTPTLPEGVRHVPGGTLARPVVMLKAVIANTEQHWFVYERDDDTADSVATRVAKTQRHINWLREKFGGETVQTPNTPASVHADDQLRDCQWHGQMKWSTKVPGTQYCSHKMADGSYCKEKWPKRAGESA